MKDALMAAERVAPFRHPKLGAVKLAGDVNNPLRMLDTASKDELKAEILSVIADRKNGVIVEDHANPNAYKPVLTLTAV